MAKLSGVSAADRANYTRLRDMVQKRLKRARLKGIDLPDVPKIADLSAPIDFWAAFQYMQDLIFTGIPAYWAQYQAEQQRKQKEEEREQQILDTLHDHGYDINDLDAFGEFMDMFRATALGRMYGSDQAAEMYEEAEEQGIGLDDLRANYDKYLEVMEAIGSGDIDLPDNSDSGSIWETIREYVDGER